MSMLWLLALILASFRLTRLVVDDTILDGIRSRIAHLPVIGNLITCHWCAGFWISLGLVAADYLWAEQMYLPVLVFAVAGGQGLIASYTTRA